MTTKFLCDNLNVGTRCVPYGEDLGWGDYLVIGVEAVVAIIGLIIVIKLLFSSIRVAREYERGIVFRLGRFKAIRGPGLYFVIPGMERVVTLSLRLATYAVKGQQMITSDNVSLHVEAVVFFRVKDPRAALIEINDFRTAIEQLALSALRSGVSGSSMTQVLTNRNRLAEAVRDIMEEVTEKWGVETERVELQQIELPEEMKRAMARQAEAEREKMARITKAEGELEASQKLTEAATMLATSPGAIELRRLQTLSEIGAEHNSTIVIGIPTELLAAAKAIGGRDG